MSIQDPIVIVSAARTPIGGLLGDDALATVTALGFSGDGQWLAAGDNKGAARVWKRGQTDKPFIGSMPPAASSLQHADAIRDIGFHPSEPTLLTTASDDHTTRVWSIDLVTGLLIPNSAEQKTQHKLQHDRSVQRTRFVARVDDQFRLMTVSDKRVYFWTDEATRDERRHDDTVTDANVSADGEMLVTASNDGTARVWSSRSSTPIAVLRGHRNEVTRAFFAPSAAGGNAGQATVITTSTDRTLRRWRVQAPRLLVAEKTWIHSAVVTPDGQQAVVCGEPVALGGAGGAGSGGTGDDKTANCLVVPLTGSPWARRPREALRPDPPISTVSVSSASRYT